MNDPCLELKHLKLLVALVDEGGLTKAGDVLHLTQSALSHQLRDAEDRLGIRLFHRINKKMVLTPAGKELLQASRSLLADLSRTEDQIRSFANGKAGLIRLSTQCYTCYGWLPKVMKEFRVRHPKVEVRIDLEATADPVSALLDGRLDLAISFAGQTNRFVNVYPLFRDEMLVILPTAHPLCEKKTVKPEDFEGQTVLIYPPKEASTFLTKILQPRNVKPKQIFEVPLTEAVVELVSEGIGLALLSRWAVARHVSAGIVAARPLGSRGFYRDWSAVTLKELADQDHLHDFVQLIAPYRPV